MLCRDERDRVHTASFVARETGYAMHGWGHGDRMTNEAFAPIETFRASGSTRSSDVQELGFDAIDIWGAHLSPAWATEEHVDAARAGACTTGMRVATYAPWIDAGERRARVRGGGRARAAIVGAGFAGDADGDRAGLSRARCPSRGREPSRSERPPSCSRRSRAATACSERRSTRAGGATQGYDAAQAIGELGEHVLHVHLKDVLAEGEPHETCRFGEGIVDVARVRTRARADRLRRSDQHRARAGDVRPERRSPRDARASSREWLA